MEDNYSKAYKEIIEILKYVPQESVNKIPQIMIDTFKSKMDINYEFEIDINKSFEEQKILEETKAILANIFRDYWATPYQKERIEAKEKYDRKKIEEKNREQFNTDIFNNQKYSNEITNKKEISNNLPIEAKKDNFYKRILAFFKKLFNLE